MRKYEGMRFLTNTFSCIFFIARSKRQNLRQVSFVFITFYNKKKVFKTGLRETVYLPVSNLPPSAQETKIGPCRLFSVLLQSRCRLPLLTFLL